MFNHAQTMLNHSNLYIPCLGAGAFPAVAGSVETKPQMGVPGESENGGQGLFLFHGCELWDVLGCFSCFCLCMFFLFVSNNDEQSL